MAGGDMISPLMKQAVVEDELDAIMDFLDKGMNFLAIAIALILI